ncbi:amidohydrolase [Nonomuraea sp. NPDC049269]|uniref:amidohydrolase n=1 Tax=Nonomuraea sp. NPDC049269 TaxID=3364349 RepID=UPI00371F8250
MTILHIARLVHTLDPAHGSATGVLVEDGRVVAVGSAADLSADRVIDHGDAVITPGLVDGHTHPVHGLGITAGVDLSTARDLGDVRAGLASARDRLEPGQWLRGWGLNPIVFAGVTPSAEAIGLVGVPGIVLLYDVHSAIASPEALQIAGIDGPRDFASSARIECDADGRPTGYLLESEASRLVTKHLPAPIAEELASRFGELLRAMADSGLTGMHAMDFNDPAHELVTLLEERGDLPVRIGFNPVLMPDHDDLDVVLAPQGLSGRRWRVEGVKLFMDGTIDGGTAWLEYADAHGEGLEPLWRDLDRFRDALTRLHLAGVNCAVHAIGDRGIRETLAIFDDLRTQYGPLARHRIEHIETLPDEVVSRFGHGAAAASVQPLHCTFFNRPDRSDSWSQRLGDIRVDHGFRWGELRAAGAVVALGSDWPIAPYDPRWTMADAQLRRHFDHADPTPLPSSSSALTALQALEGYTTQAALASGEESHRGRLAPGFDADLTVWADDPLTVDPQTLAELPVVTTVVAGDPVALTA